MSRRGEHETPSDRSPRVLAALALRGAARGVAYGLAGGAAGFALDWTTTAATIGFWLPVEAWHVAAYVLVGALVGALVGVASSRIQSSAALQVATVLAVLQVAALAERLDHGLRQALGARAAWWTGGLTFAALVAGFVAWTWLLSRLLGGDRRWRWALALAAVTSSFGLALNRNLLSAVVSRSALLADLAVVVGVALLAWGLGRFDRRRAAAALVVAALLAGVATWLHRPPAPGTSPADTSATVASEARTRPPHLVLVVIDTLRLDVFEAVLAETEEGRRFRDAVGDAAYVDGLVAAAPWTAPSMASIMTSLWPPEHGYGYSETFSRHAPLSHLPRSTRTLAEQLEARGYATSAWVANPVLGVASGLHRGFERFELLNGATSKLPLLTVLERLGLIDQEIYLDAAAVRDRVRSHLPSLAEDPRPHYLWIHLMDPHLPLRERRGLAPDPAASTSGDERLYRDEVRFALAQLTTIIGLLERHGLYDDAVFVVTSDHGEMFPSDGHGGVPPGQPRLYGHGHALYGELMHVPLIIRPPGGLGAPRRVDALASHVDLLPTFGDLLGLDLRHPAADRYSLAPLLARAPVEAAPRRPYALLGANHVGHPQRGLRGDGHKLILYDDRRLGPELFDLEADPRQRRNLADVDDARRDEMARVLELAWKALDRAEGGRPVELDEETREQLRALGYLD